MKNRFAISILLAVFAFLASEQARAQGVPQPIYDVACPAGSTPLGQAPNPVTGHLKVYLCLDSQGNVTSPTLSGAGPGANNFSPTNYTGWHGDTREVVDASWAGGGATLVTCPNSDCGFTANDNGKLCWAMPGGSNTSGPSAPGTFTFVSATSGNCTASAIIGTASSNGVFEWGHDDTAAWVAAVSSLYTQPKCGNIVVPAARSMINQGLSYTGTVASDCSINVTGYGYDSVLVIEPGFSFSAVTNSVGTTSKGPFFGTSAATAFLYFTISGTNQSLSGISTAPASALFTIGPGDYAIGVNLFDWATSTTNSPQGANIAGTGPFGIGFATTNWGDGNIWCSGAYCIGENDGGTATFKTQGGGLAYDYSGTYGGIYTTGSAAEFHGYGSTAGANSGGFGAASCDHNGGELVFLDGAKIGFGTPGSGGIGFQFNANGSGANCVVHARNSQFKGGGSGAAVNVSSGVTADFWDDGGNTFSSPAFVNAGTLRVHHREAGTCTFAASTTCTVTFAETFGNSTLPTFLVTGVNPGAVTFTVTALSTTAATITASASNSLNVGWEAVLQ